MLAGKSPADWREDVFCEHKFKKFNNWHAVCGQRYKYVVYYDEPDGPYECLYDLKKDPAEFLNLAADPEYAGVLSKMKSRLKGYLLATPIRDLD